MSKFDVGNDVGLNSLRFFKVYADRVVDKTVVSYVRSSKTIQIDPQKPNARTS